MAGKGEEKGAFLAGLGRESATVSAGVGGGVRVRARARAAARGVLGVGERGGFGVGTGVREGPAESEGEGISDLWRFFCGSLAAAPLGAGVGGVTKRRKQAAL